MIVWILFHPCALMEAPQTTPVTPPVITPQQPEIASPIPSSSNDTATPTQQIQQQHQDQQAQIVASLDKQSEFHGDYTTITLSKPCPRGVTIKVVAHLGLPGGALLRIFNTSGKPPINTQQSTRY